MPKYENKSCFIHSFQNFLKTFEKNLGKKIFWDCLQDLNKTFWLGFRKDFR